MLFAPGAISAPSLPDAVGVDAIETLNVPRVHGLGDVEVGRTLPAPQRQMSSWTLSRKKRHHLF